MDVLEAIMTRKSVPGFLPEAPDRATVEKLLEAACTAPNHHLTEPWRFAVIAGEARDALGEVMETTLRERMLGEDEMKIEGQAMGERKKLQRAPVVIAVSMRRDPMSDIPPFEDMTATAAAVQNLILAAQGMGLGTFWRSGNSVFDPALKTRMGFEDGDEVIAFVYLGYPDLEAPARMTRPRTGFQDKTVWLGWD